MTPSTGPRASDNDTGKSDAAALRDRANRDISAAAPLSIRAAKPRLAAYYEAR